MSTISNILLDKEILLESGTNELELLVFDIADFTFGINVAKVREVLSKPFITQLPRAHRSIRGVFKLRNQVIPCVSLLDHLGIVSTKPEAESTMILADFNKQQTAFLVNSVERIHRLSWENILAVPGLEALSHTPVTALARCDNRLIVMLDFEMILDDVTSQFFRTNYVENPMGLPREQLRILLAEDSPTVREAVGTTLHNSGYTQVTTFENGAEAWNWIEERLKQTGRLEDIADLMIADVEMPQIDGFHLTKCIKSHPVLKSMPVLLYSSIITPDNHKKGLAVGADAQVAKPELEEVVRLADELISTARKEQRMAEFREVSELVRPVSEQIEKENEVLKTVEKVAVVEPVVAAVEIQTEELVSDLDAVKLEAFQVTENEDCEESVPQYVNAKLWNTFKREMKTRSATLGETLARTRGGDLSEALLREMARTLHTIKSASMVIPLDPVTRCTHLVENLLENARLDNACWQQEKIEAYLTWIELLLTATGNIDAALEAGTGLALELQG